MTVTIAVALETPLQDEVEALLRQSDEIAARLYPGAFRRAITAASLDRHDSLVVVARVDGRAAGLCVVFDRGDGSAELKRMVVDEGSRGRGIGGALLAAAEAAARGRGILTMLLEVGTRNVEARDLYARAGYRARAAFPPYAPTSIASFMEKALA